MDEEQANIYIKRLHLSKRKGYTFELCSTLLGVKQAQRLPKSQANNETIKELRPRYSDLPACLSSYVPSLKLMTVQQQQTMHVLFFETEHRCSARRRTLLKTSKAWMALALHHLKQVPSCHSGKEVYEMGV